MPVLWSYLRRAAGNPRPGATAKRSHSIPRRPGRRRGPLYATPRALTYTLAWPFPAAGPGHGSRDTSMKKTVLVLTACALFALRALAADVELKSDHPQEYVVRKGDTLWDISARFLERPWLWPEIWQVNPHIRNPHLIYPGDRLSLVYVDGNPRLMLSRGRGGDVKLSPQIRSSPIDDAIPALPLEEINAFLSRSRIVGTRDLEAAPYVLSGAHGHVITGAGDSLHARGAFAADQRNYGVFRGGQLFVDPETGEVLGKQALEIGAGRLVDENGDIGTLDILRSNEEIRAGDRLLPAVEQKITARFTPSPPAGTVTGVVLAVEGGVSQVGRLDIVVLNRGQRDGLEDGNVLAISKRGETVLDPVTRERVTLPDARAGLLMVFRTFEKMSYGLVLDATMPLKVMDKVANP